MCVSRFRFKIKDSRQIKKKKNYTTYTKYLTLNHNYYSLRYDLRVMSIYLDTNVTRFWFTYK